MSLLVYPCNMRLFTAIELPETVRDALSRICCGLPRARWVPEEQMHLTLRFIGEFNENRLDELDACLATVEVESFSLTLRGVGCFPPRRDPRVLWVGVENPAPLVELKRRIDRALAEIGVPRESRKFAPHCTLARVARTPLGRTTAFLVEHSDLRLEPFTVSGFHLFSSLLTPKGAVHRHEAEYPFAGGNY